jgi:hypothetical protein
MITIDALSVRELLKLHSNVLEALRTRGTLRSGNNPVADYAEGLCVRAFGWRLVTKSTKGHDAIDSAGQHIEIKARRITPQNASRQMSAIRGIQDQHFALLAGVLFDADFAVTKAVLVPHAVVLANSTFVPQTNSWRFILRDSVWKEPGVVDITRELQEAQA